MRLPATQFVKNAGVIGDNHTVEISPRVNAVFEQIRERISGFVGVASVAAGIRPPFGETSVGDQCASTCPHAGRKIRVDRGFEQGRGRCVPCGRKSWNGAKRRANSHCTE
jgi:hypothetical protein